jgi:hypothetical protein
MNTDELVIDESNFSDYFFDARKHGPKPGQVMACYETYAEFVDGNLKRDVLHLLTNTDKVEAAQRLLQRVGAVIYEDSLRIIQEMTDDLLNGMSPAEVAAKPYEMRLQFFYYTDKELVPNDPHWWHSKLIECRHSDETDALINIMDEEDRSSIENQS